MGDVELLINKEGQLKVVRRYDPRVPFIVQQWKGLERHRAVRWLNCRRRPSTGNTTTLLLKAIFLNSLILAGVRFSMELCFTGNISWLTCFVWPIWLLLLVVTGMVPLALLIALVVVWAVDKVTPPEKKKRTAKRRRREEVKTISGLIQQV